MTQDTGRFAHWKLETPPPPRPVQRWIRIGSAAVAVVAVLGLVVYGVGWLFDAPPEPKAPELPRADFGYFELALLRPGDCFSDTGLETAVRNGHDKAHNDLPQVVVVPCTRRHSAEVFYVFKLPTGPSMRSADEIEHESDVCDAALINYAAPHQLKQVEVWYYGVADEVREYDGEPQGVCVAANRSARRTRGSISDPAVAPA